MLFDIFALISVIPCFCENVKVKNLSNLKSVLKHPVLQVAKNNTRKTVSTSHKVEGWCAFSGINVLQICRWFKKKSQFSLMCKSLLQSKGLSNLEIGFYFFTVKKKNRIFPGLESKIYARISKLKLR